MRIFTTKTKVNFVDENNVLLGYDTDIQCCENAGWIICDLQQCENVQQLNIIEDQQQIEKLNEELKYWSFDTTYKKEYSILPKKCTCDEEDTYVVVFRITLDNNSKFIHLYNCHNGYYSHRFIFSKPVFENKI